jgi:hypothetical protein
VAYFREIIVQIELPPLVGEDSANFCGYRAPRDQRDGFLRPYSLFSRPDRYIFFQAALQLYSQSWLDPEPHSPLLSKSCSSVNRTRTSGSVARNSDYYRTRAPKKRRIGDCKSYEALGWSRLIAKRFIHFKANKIHQSEFMSIPSETSTVLLT